MNIKNLFNRSKPNSATIKEKSKDSQSALNDELEDKVISQSNI